MNSGGRRPAPKLHNPVAATLLAAGCCIAAPAAAEMGTVKAGPGEFYAGVSGGYVHAEGYEQHAFTQAPGFFAPPRIDLRTDPEGGVNFTFSGGYVLAPELFGLADPRVEASLGFTQVESDLLSTGGFAFVVAPSGQAFTGFNGLAGRQRLRMFDVELALKGDAAFGDDFTLTLSGGMFYRLQDNDQTVFAPTAGFLELSTANIGTQYFGLAVGAQPEYRLRPGVALVGDLSAGVYGFHADGDFSRLNSLGGDRTNGFGFRGRAIGGVKLDFFEATTMTLFAGVTYWSSVPEFQEARISFALAPLRPASLGRTDALEFSGGVTVTVGFGE